MNRISAFLRDVGSFYETIVAGKPVKSRVSKLKSHSISLKAVKSDDVLRPLAIQCELLLDELTDGKPYNKEKIDVIWGEIGQEVKVVWHLIYKQPYA